MQFTFNVKRNQVSPIKEYRERNGIPVIPVQVTYEIGHKKRITILIFDLLKKTVISEAGKGSKMSILHPCQIYPE